MTLAPFPSTVQGAVIAAVIASVAKASAAVLIKWVTTVLYYYTNWLRIIYPNPGYSTLLESATTLFDVVILVGVIELIRNMVRRRHVELLTAITKGDASSRRHLESNPLNKGGADSVHGGSVSNASRPSESIRAQECLITHVTDSVENEELDPDRLMDYIERALEPNPTGNGLRQN